MLREGQHIDPAGVNRTKSFRNAFIAGFTSRIGQRLLATDQQTTASADTESGGALVPVLVRRSADVDRFLHEKFPALRTTRTRVTNATGWHAGQSAGESANISGSTTPLP